MYYGGCVHLVLYWVKTILAQTIMLNSFFGWYIRWLRGTLHGDTRNSLLALLVLYIPSGISNKFGSYVIRVLWRLCTPWLVLGRTNFLCLFRELQALCRGILAIVSLHYWLIHISENSDCFDKLSIQTE